MTPADKYTGGPKGRILIVDDELVVRDSLQKWFDSEGYETGAAAGGREALTAIQEKQWDLALIDIKMPGMDGMDLQKKLREVDPELIVVIMTGYASVETAVQALKARRLRLHHQAHRPRRTGAPGLQRPGAQALPARAGASAGESAGDLPRDEAHRQQSTACGACSSSSKWWRPPTPPC